jgi:primosomal replication protein N
VNRAVLLARISEVGPLRYTPAGLPAFDLSLEHESELEEAGQQRKVKARVRAVAFGAVAERIARQPVGSQWQFTGFLATPGNGQRLVLHIQEFQQT